MNQIDKLPELEWSDVAARQLQETSADEVLRRSQFVFQLGDYGVAGFIYSSFLAPPWFWFLLAKNVGMKQLIDLRRKQDMIPRGSRTAVEADDTVALRFAKFYGFYSIGTHGQHVIMEKR